VHEVRECYYCKNYIPHDTPNCPHCKSPEPLPLARTYVGPGLGMVAFALAGLLFIPPYRGVPWTGFIICMAVAFLFACNFVIGMVSVIKVVPVRRLMRRYKRHKRHNFTDSCHCLYCGKLNLHDWDGCICTRCGARRDKEHDWDGCICRHCGQRKFSDDEGHIWDGCVCTVCGARRDKGHDVENCICRRCGGAVHEWQEVGREFVMDQVYARDFAESDDHYGWAYPEDVGWDSVTYRCTVCGKEKTEKENSFFC